MVAVRDIKQMEVILTENPVVMGPYTKIDSLHCVECFKAGNHKFFIFAASLNPNSWMLLEGEGWLNQPEPFKSPRITVKKPIFIFQKSIMN